MSLAVRYEPDAQVDLEDAALWYEASRAELGMDFVAAVEGVVERARREPLYYPVVHRDVHSAPLRRFPYAVYYRVLADTLIVVAVLHSHRNPNTWRTRLP